MSGYKDDLYRWERLTKPRVYSRTQRITGTGDIQDWIKKVEDASNKAAEETFGRKAGKERGKREVKERIEDVHQHDAAYVEAQELLQTWMKEKVDLEVEDEYSEENWTKKTQAEIKKEWDHLLELDDNEEEFNYNPTPRLKPKEDPYKILEADTDSAVDEILQNLMDKEVVHDDFLNDLGFEDKRKKAKDPRLKMQLRCQQVKENKEKRTKEKESRLRELQSKKDTQFAARQMIKKEEQSKALKAKQEEMEIQKEMAKLRKEMQDDRKKMEEQKLREKKEKEMKEMKLQEEIDTMRLQDEKEKLKRTKNEEQKRRLIMQKMGEISARQVTNNLRILQKCFSAWYEMLLESRLKMGKSRALADWRLQLKCWNAWKSYTRSKKIEIEANVHQNKIKENQRKQCLATEHRKQRLLKRCFDAWQIFTQQNLLEKDLHSTQNQTRSKMQNFLEAAAKGTLWKKGDEQNVCAGEGRGEGDGSKVKKSNRTMAASVDSTSQKVEDLFAQSPKPAMGGDDTERSDLSTERSNKSNKSPSKKGRHIQAWQLTRKHVSQTNGDLDSFRENTSEDGTQEKRAWEKAPFVPKQYEHRHAAQQNILENQQKQIKEQQRLIEELTYLQRQQLLQQQITNDHLLKQRPLETPGGDGNQHEMLQPDSGNGVQMGLELDQLKDMESARSDNSSTIQTGAMSSNRTETSSLTLNTERTTSTTLSKSSVSTNPKHTQFLRTMEDRAAERTRLKKEREEKKKKDEEERLAKLEAEAEERKKLEEEEKKRKFEEFRQKKKLEKEREIEKQNLNIRLKELNIVAVDHHRLAIMKYTGWLPWMQLLKMGRRNRDISSEHYRKTILSKCLLSWHQEVRREVKQKEDIADELHEILITQRCFRNWKRINYYASIQEEKADRHFSSQLICKFFRTWADYTEDEKILMWRKERHAKEHNTKRIQLTALRAWRRYPKVIQEVEEKEKRRQEMRRKVASMLPDFEGLHSSKTSIELG